MTDTPNLVGRLSLAVWSTLIRTAGRLATRVKAELSRLPCEVSARANVFAVAVFCLLVAARITDVISNGWSPEVPFTFSLFVIPMLYALPTSRKILDRYGWATLVVQGGLTWTAFAIFGKQWQVGIGGLLAGLVLLVVRSRLSWVLAGLLLLAEVTVRLTITGMPYSPTWLSTVVVITYYVDDAMIIFAVVRISQIVAELEEARTRSAQMAIESERLRATASLKSAVGEDLGSIVSNAVAAQVCVSSDPQEAKARITVAGTAARNAAEKARSIPLSGPIAERPSIAPTQGKAVIGARLSWAVFVTVLLAFSVENASIVFAFFLHLGARRVALVITGMVLIAVLQLRHSYAAREDRRPRAWPITLTLQALLVYSFLFPFIWLYNGALAPFLAGSVLLLLRRWWRWVVFAAVVLSYSPLIVELPLVDSKIVNGGPPSLALVLNYVVEIALVGLLIYGLSRLAATARELEALREHVAQGAAVQERLRVARDVHDLLGLGLSAIALKADLIERLIDRDEDAVSVEIQELCRICASATAEIRLIAHDGARLQMRDELEAEEQILTSGGIQVRAYAPNGPLPNEANEVLAPVLREAVTNVLRHSKATACFIEIENNDDVLTLQISNDGTDGVSPPNHPNGDTGGRGLANLASRIASADGHLECHQSDGWFALSVRVPSGRSSTFGRVLAQSR